MNLFQVKHVIFQTECERLVLDGVCCSEPVMTRDEKGILDHYFLYGEDEALKSYFGPAAVFGIYSDQARTAYIRKPAGERAIRALNWNQYDKKAYDLYCETFPRVREFLFRAECSEEEKKVLRAYVESFRRITDGGLWPLYQEIGGEFFQWAREAGS